MLRTLLVSGTLFTTVALSVALGVLLGYAAISGFLRLMMWRRSVPVPARERNAGAPALSLGAD